MGCFIDRNNITLTKDSYIEKQLINNVHESKDQHYYDIPINKSYFPKIKLKALEDDYNILVTLYKSEQLEVLKIKHKGHDFERAAKIFPVDDEKLSKKQLNEYKFLRVLDHANIIRIHDVYLEYNKCSFILDLINGTDIFNAVKMIKPLTLGSYIFIIKQLLHVINYLHSLRIFHFNICSTNILALSSNSRKHGIIHSYMKFSEKDQDIHPILIDFRKAIMFNSSKIKVDPERFMYTEYTAPEVLKGEYSIKSEIWSIGAVIFKFVSGFPLYDTLINSEEFGWKEIIKEGKLSINSKAANMLNFDMKDFLEAILNPSPSERLSIMELLDMPLFSVNKVLDDTSFLVKYKTKLANLNLCHELSQNKFYKAVSSFLILSCFKVSNHEQILCCFNTINIKNNGNINQTDFKEGLRRINLIFPMSQDYKLLFELIDLNKDGLISFYEFASTLIEKSILFTTQNLYFAFDFISKDKSVISMKDVAEFLFIKTYSGSRYKQLRRSLQFIIEELKSSKLDELNEDFFVDTMKALTYIEEEEKKGKSNNQSFNATVMLESAFKSEMKDSSFNMFGGPTQKLDAENNSEVEFKAMMSIRKNETELKSEISEPNQKRSRSKSSSKHNKEQISVK